MLILALLLLALVAVPLTGGRLERLTQLGLERQRLIVVALLLQVLAISVVPGWPRPVLVAAHLASYGLAAAFVWLNRRVAGVPLVALGAALNAVTIALNGGTLPASPSALRQAGITTPPGEFVNSAALADPRLGFLGDVFASPAWLPLRNVYSVGDALILAGAVYAIHVTCRRPTRAQRRRSAATPSWAKATRLAAAGTQG
ncbi:MAG: DUF5317 domain-containing protein [Mycobacteriales bacterium]|nr:DUF5317 domain-containing protein [Mycobacteriales bacterium]